MKKIKFIKMDPPGTILNKKALRHIVSRFIKDKSTKNFLDIGCGEGTYSEVLLRLGLQGVGIDFSEKSLDVAKENLVEYTSSQKYSTICGDFTKTSFDKKFDVIISWMVLEHVEDDTAFIQNMEKLLNDGGVIISAVPARMKFWGIEDDLVGHYRRYEKKDLIEKISLSNINLKELSIYSICFPICNILLKISNYLVEKGQKETKKNLSMLEKTKLSGYNDLKFKTVFPPVFALILNERVFAIFDLIQRVFFRFDLGITYIFTAKKGD